MNLHFSNSKQCESQYINEIKESVTSWWLAVRMLTWQSYERPIQGCSKTRIHPQGKVAPRMRFGACLAGRKRLGVLFWDHFELELVALFANFHHFFSFREEYF